MSIHPIMQKLADKLKRTDLPEFAPGDTIRVQVKIREGEKERLQAFEGMVIACKNGPQGTFTVRKMSFGQGVERIFPFNSKVVDKVEKIRSYNFTDDDLKSGAPRASSSSTCTPAAKNRLRNTAPSSMK